MAVRENELKYELDEASYGSLLAMLVEVQEPRCFLNTYFVTVVDTGRSDWVLRLRREPQAQEGELTLKVGRQLSAGIFSSEESSVWVESLRPCDWEGSEPLHLFREEISREPLRLQGEALNERRFVKSPFGPAAYWEVDRTELPNGEIHYELEVEYPSDMDPTREEMTLFRGELESFLLQNGWVFRPSGKTKYRRFLDAL